MTESCDGREAFDQVGRHNYKGATKRDFGTNISKETTDKVMHIYRNNQTDKQQKI